MKKSVVMVNNETGIHARPASMIVQEANNFDSEVFIVKDDKEVSAKSIMGIMSLGVNQSTEVTIKAEGSDEEEAVQALVDLIEDGFGE
ncbi:phosphotransferase system HPr (HPr) family protein [Halobacteroides halobius DSM 5150]|uniref:Phosphocarrier protein HPr n=1 Tax=Halobacteroides halobius (strain ATCC 35273 / DSM 5150 / MD-1) TaxID=748449 RepID=L0KAK8_HALHC|nr:HPr family phosphocarrier protein [Halobacteroides halobius]AGB41399.1 phosphotransferase system HPr (HPr) family protein [Halobacteroides halobius DSM 5150]